MERKNKTYGFTIAIKELRETVPNIFRYASAFRRTNNITSTGLWNMFIEKPKKNGKTKHAKTVLDKSLVKNKVTNENQMPEDILKTDPESSNLPSIDPNSMEGESYNMCHYWSNFEIANLDWFRSKSYNDFFNMMDRSGGFWMERVRSPSWMGCVNLLTRIGSGEMPRSTHLR
jgi:mannosyltransferase